MRVRVPLLVLLAFYIDFAEIEVKNKKNPLHPFETDPSVIMVHGCCRCVLASVIVPYTFFIGRNRAKLYPGRLFRRG